MHIAQCMQYHYVTTIEIPFHSHVLRLAVYLPCSTCSDQSHKRTWRQILSCIFVVIFLLIFTNRQSTASLSPQLSLVHFCESRQRKLRPNTMRFSILEKGSKSQLAVMQSRQQYF